MQRPLVFVITLPQIYSLLVLALLIVLYEVQSFVYGNVFWHGVCEYVHNNDDCPNLALSLSPCQEKTACIQLDHVMQHVTIVSRELAL